jgi:mediator of RNA polymerase II transcription subunit 16, fungi type
MDDGLDVDDLFGDAGPLDLSPAPPAKGLAQRLEDLRSSGCCQ